MRSTSSRLAALLTLVSIALAPMAQASAEMTVGLVTRLDGTATLTRATLPQGAPLKFKDGVFVADRITTGEESLARILFGGKALVTVRERSVLTISEAPGVSTLHVGAGKITVAVVKERVRPGETIDIRTPNAVATIRGTVVVAEVSPETTAPGTYTTTITVLKGVVDLRQLDGLTRQPVGPTLNLRAVERVRITGTAASPLPHKLSAEVTQQLVKELKTNVKPVPDASAAILGSELRPAFSGSASVNSGGRSGSSKARHIGPLVKLPAAVKANSKGPR